MEAASQILDAPVSGLVAVAVWAILFVVIWETLKQASTFSRPASFVLSVAASLLAVIGMFGRFPGASGQADGAANGGSFEFLLLPSAAMGISVLIVLLLLLVARCSRSDRRASREVTKGDLTKETGISRMREIQQDRRQDLRADDQSRHDFGTQPKMSRSRFSRHLRRNRVTHTLRRSQRAPKVKP